MSSWSVRIAAACFVICGCSMSLLAQGRGYHMELSDGTSGWVILVNDSQIPIEAFHFVGKCRIAGREVAGSEFTYDALDSPGNSLSHPAITGRAQSDVVKPGERYFALTKLLPQPSECIWDGDITSVIYADGTYEGEENTARDLQARRDGIAAGVQYWVERVQGGVVEKPDPEAMAAEAKQLSEETRTKTRYCVGPNQPLSCAYWSGRHQVDANVALQGSRKKEDPESNYAWMTQFIKRWRKKVEADDALKRLDVTFPLPGELAGQTALLPATP
jgi:hypothetical protein